jgi:hypothetical protein
VPELEPVVALDPEANPPEAVVPPVLPPVAEWSLPALDTTGPAL